MRLTYSTFLAWYPSLGSTDLNSADVVQALVREEASSEQIAQNSPLSESFVALVARGLHDPNLVRSRELREGGPAIFPFWQKWTNRPWLFVFLSTLIVLALFVLVTLLVNRTIPSGSRSLWKGLIGAVLFGVLVLSHTVCYLRHCMVRHVLFGAVGLFGATLSLVVILRITNQIDWASTFGFALASIFVCVFYCLIQVPVAVLGGYLRVRKQGQVRTNLTRQQLIENLFNVRERLAKVSIGEPPETGWTERPNAIWLRDHIYAFAAISGFCYAFLYAIMVLVLDPQGKMFSGGSLSASVVIGQLIFAVGSLALTIAIGLGAQRAGRAISAYVVHVFASMPIYLIPLGPFGPKFFNREFMFSTIGTLIIFGTVVLACSVGVTIEQSARRDRMLAANNKEVLESEIADLERRLRPESRRICVMDVDAYRSARMKADADAFEAEWSFREYQIWIARVCNRYLGVVHATAGDGAVVGFPSSAQALEAAIALQAEMAVFNLRVNRLPTPFMIRIGLHTGEVQGALDQVQFTEVIDVAAHVQKAVPVGTIGLTERTVENLDRSQFQNLEQKVDGYSVFVLNGVCGPAETL
ncbi:MAG: hypothetical protein K8R88_05430 [Armatimonadetes bacterium]|nr:hypothetical protein [Armatimonadota bacterium]